MLRVLLPSSRALADRVLYKRLRIWNDLILDEELVRYAGLAAVMLLQPFA